MYLHENWQQGLQEWSCKQARTRDIFFINNPSQVEYSGGMPSHPQSLWMCTSDSLHFLWKSRPLVSFKTWNLFLFLQVNIFSCNPFSFILFQVIVSYLQAQSLAMVH